MFWKAVLAQALIDLIEDEAFGTRPESFNTTRRRGRTWTKEQKLVRALQALERAAHRYGWPEEKLAYAQAELRAANAATDESVKASTVWLGGRVRPGHRLHPLKQQDIRDLRAQGYSIRRIMAKTGAAKQSVMGYAREVPPGNSEGGNGAWRKARP